MKGSKKYVMKEDPEGYPAARRRLLKLVVQLLRLHISDHFLMLLDPWFPNFIFGNSNLNKFESASILLKAFMSQNGSAVLFFKEIKFCRVMFLLFLASNMSENIFILKIKFF